MHIIHLARAPVSRPPRVSAAVTRMATIPYADADCVVANFDRNVALHMLIAKPRESAVLAFTRARRGYWDVFLWMM